jgi:hypothetical protein
LNSNELEDEGVCLLLEPFASALTDNNIQVLYLDQNEIGPMGAKALRLARLDHLQLLSVVDNDDMPQSGLIETYGNRVSFGNTEDAYLELKADATCRDGPLSVKGARHQVAAEPETVIQFELVPQSEMQMPMDELVAALEQTSYQVDDVLLQDKQEEVVPETDAIQSSRNGETDDISKTAVLSAVVPVDKAQISQGNNKSDGISELFRKKEKSAKASKRSDPGSAKQQHSSSMGEIAEFSKKVEDRYDDWKEDTASNEKPEVLPLTSPVDLGKPFSLAMALKKKREALEDSSVTELMAAIQLMSSLQIGTPPRGPKPEPNTQAATEPHKITAKAGVTLSRSPGSTTKVELGPLKQRPSISEASENHAQLGNTAFSTAAREPPRGLHRQKLRTEKADKRLSMYLVPTGM